jgi:Tol biopolymer transport system component
VAQAICDAPSARYGAWNQQDVILFATYGAPIQKINAAGGVPSPALPKEENEKNPDQRAPQFLPDGKHFLFISFGEKTGIRMGSLDGEPAIFIMPQTTSPAFYSPPVDRAPGFLLFIRQGQLMAQPFDAKKARLAGDAVPVAFPLGSGPTFFPSASGALLLRRSRAAPIQLVWVDRSGKPLGQLGEPGLILQVRISPKGRSVAVNRVEASNPDIWLHDLERKTATRFTFEPGPDANAVWSPDGQQLAYYSVRRSQRVLSVRPVSGMGREKILYQQPSSFAVTDWSHDGRWLVVMPRQGPDSAVLVPATGDGKPVSVLHRDFDERDVQISPDGQWLLYSSNPGGRQEIFVQSLPESVGGPPGGGRWQISTAGGRQPAWRADGKEIFYITGDAMMTAVPVELGHAKFQPGLPKPLFSANIEGDTFNRPFDVSPDGQRFLLPQPVEQATSQPLTVILNWQSLLKK